ncbi:MAG: T9SS type A sorting domain-containing protein [Saprospiraceae bacterium]|nr:T9SS type A sorting domain-containing protein [Saprospiraceae bacterium]
MKTAAIPCRTVTIGTSGAEDTGQKPYYPFPNPVADILLVTLGEYIPQNGKIHIHDATGRVIMSQRLYYGHNHLNMTDLSPGLYFWFAEDDGVKMKRGKVVKM